MRKKDGRTESHTVNPFTAVSQQVVSTKIMPNEPWAARANNRYWALSWSSHRNRSILNRADPASASQPLASSHCTVTSAACPAGRQKGQKSCPHPTSTAVMPGELWWEQHWRQGSVQGPGASVETCPNWIRLVLGPLAGTQHGVTVAAAHATHLAGRP